MPTEYDNPFAKTLEKYRRPMIERILCFSLDDYTDEEVENIVKAWNSKPFSCFECGRPYEDE